MKFVNEDDWDSAAAFLSGIAIKLEEAGADAIVLCANTTHLTAETVQRSIRIPILHIVDAVAAEIEKQNMKKVGLLGTRFTMEKDFFAGRLKKFGIDAVVPGPDGRMFIHESIYNELGKNIFLDETKHKYLQIIDELNADGAEGVILGCTEIPLLIKQADCGIPVFDTTFIHAKYAVDFALSSE
jgi:aspartate racemase